MATLSAAATTLILLLCLQHSVGTLRRSILTTQTASSGAHSSGEAAGSGGAEGRVSSGSNAEKERHSHLAPKQLAAWRSFAQKRGCSLDDAEYEPIFRGLEPFRRRGGIREEEVEAAYTGAGSYFGLGPGLIRYRIKGGQYQRHTTPAWCTADGKTYFDRLMPEMLAHLPDVTFLANTFDQPRSWVAPLPPDVEAALADGSLAMEDAFRRHACDGAGYGHLKRTHGMLGSRQMWPWRRAAFPFFSNYALPGCFADIPVPVPLETGDGVFEPFYASQCPTDGEWASKKPVAIWRGSTTGGQVEGLYPEEDWRLFHRQRLLNYSRQHADAVDAAFTSYLQCAPPLCAAMEREYGPPAPRMSWAEQARHKYIVLVDGNSAALRWSAALCTGSTILATHAFDLWLHFKLKPWEHYVPVKWDYSDLAEKVEWARQHDGEARAIAERAARLCNTRLRLADHECYIFRAVLEYAAIFRPAEPAQPAGTREAAAGDAATAAL